MDLTTLERYYTPYYFIKHKCNIVNGKREGMCIGRNKDKQKISEVMFINDKKEGLYRQWDIYGNIYMESNYVNDIKEGLTLFWYCAGKKYIEYNYISGKINGLYLIYSREGSICILDYYKDGVKVDLRFYVKEQTEKYKEELMAKVYHPDRLERMAKLYGLDTMDYMDALE